MQLKNIVFLTTQFGPGGAETQILRIALTLKAKGYDVSVVSMLPAMGFVAQLHRAGVGYHCLNMNRGKVSPLDLWRLVDLLREIQPEVIANFCFHANVLGSVAGRLSRRPVVISSIRNACFGSRKRDYVERILSSARVTDLTVTNSALVARELVERGVVHAERIRVIYNGIYCDEYLSGASSRQQTRAQLGVQGDEFLWLAVGNVRPEKNYPNLLHAFHRLREQGPGARLRVAGGFWSDEVYAEVMRLVEKYALQDSVQFLGQRMDVPLLMHAADALVLSSQTEGLPNVVMEAMASGLPVVATDVGGVRELVQEGVTGRVVPGDAPERLAESMAAIEALSQEERMAMGSRGRQHIREKFDLDVIAGQWEALFLEQLQRKSGAVSA